MGVTEGSLDVEIEESGCDFSSPDSVKNTHTHTHKRRLINDTDIEVIYKNYFFTFMKGINFI